MSGINLVETQYIQDLNDQRLGPIIKFDQYLPGAVPFPPLVALAFWHLETFRVYCTEGGRLEFP